MAYGPPSPCPHHGLTVAGELCYATVGGVDVGTPALTREGQQPKRSTDSAAAGGSSPRTWQRRPQRKTGAKLAQGARYGAEAPAVEWALRPLGHLGPLPWLFLCEWQASGLPPCPTTAVADNGVLGSPTLAVWRKRTGQGLGGTWVLFPGCLNLSGRPDGGTV